MSKRSCPQEMPTSETKRARLQQNAHSAKKVRDNKKNTAACQDRQYLITRRANRALQQERLSQNALLLSSRDHAYKHLLSEGCECSKLRAFMTTAPAPRVYFQRREPLPSVKQILERQLSNEPEHDNDNDDNDDGQHGGLSKQQKNNKSAARSRAKKNTELAVRDAALDSYARQNQALAEELRALKHDNDLLCANYNQELCKVKVPFPTEPTELFRQPDNIETEFGGRAFLVDDSVETRIRGGDRVPSKAQEADEISAANEELQRLEVNWLSIPLSEHMSRNSSLNTEGTNRTSNNLTPESSDSKSFQTVPENGGLSLGGELLQISQDQSPPEVQQPVDSIDPQKLMWLLTQTTYDSGQVPDNENIQPQLSQEPLTNLCTLQPQQQQQQQQQCDLNYSLQGTGNYNEIWPSNQLIFDSNAFSQDDNALQNNYTAYGLNQPQPTFLGNANSTLATEIDALSAMGFPDLSGQPFPNETALAPAENFPDLGLLVNSNNSEQLYGNLDDYSHFLINWEGNGNENTN